MCVDQELWGFYHHNLVYFDCVQKYGDFSEYDTERVGMI